MRCHGGGMEAVPAGEAHASHSGGSGAPPGRHYDRSARSSLDWDRETTSQEARPGDWATATPVAQWLSRSGAPRGEHPDRKGCAAPRKRGSLSASRRSIPRFRPGGTDGRKLRRFLSARSAAACLPHTTLTD
jgi:hypothetical protein